VSSITCTTLSALSHPVTTLETSVDRAEGSRAECSDKRISATVIDYTSVAIAGVLGW